MDATFHLDNAVFNVRVAGIMIENGHVLIHKQVSDSFNTKTSYFRQYSLILKHKG